ncbi:MAG TPA: MBL fold metallo-hydrolase [Candidatus Acidoferrales bacterium]|nr:MBL fold metallo-hydrolase [Candidatus Acidoferrales bacterium]
METSKGRKAAMTRRNFLRGASLAGAAWAASSWRGLPAWATPQIVLPTGAPLADAGFASAQKLAEGVYAVISDTTKGSETLCNGGFMVGRHATLVWEGFNSQKGAAFVLDTVKLATKVPVQAAIDSHFHLDHTFGNAQYTAAKIPIWAHEKVAPLMRQRYLALQHHDKAAMFAPAETHVHDAISDADKQHAEGDLKALQFVAALIEQTDITLPTRSLSPAEMPLKVDLGGRTVIIETHPGHTPGDLILRVPEENIVFTGDLIFNHSYPVTSDADMLGWLKTLDAFGRFGRKTVFVPGHGAVCGQEGVELLKSVFADLAQHARQMAQMGVPVSEAQARYTVPGQFKTLGLFAWGFCIDQAVAQFYAAARANKL